MRFLLSCDDDAEVLRFLDELDTLAVLPHRLFTLVTFITAGVRRRCPAQQV
jgi:hypothetical protein